MEIWMANSLLRRCVLIRPGDVATIHRLAVFVIADRWLSRFRLLFPRWRSLREADSGWRTFRRSWARARWRVPGVVSPPSSDLIGTAHTQACAERWRRRD